MKFRWYLWVCLPLILCFMDSCHPYFCVWNLGYSDHILTLKEITGSYQLNSYSKKMRPRMEVSFFNTRNDHSFTILSFIMILPCLSVMAIM